MTSTINTIAADFITMGYRTRVRINSGTIVIYRNIDDVSRQDVVELLSTDDWAIIQSIRVNRHQSQDSFDNVVVSIKKVGE